MLRSEDTPLGAKITIKTRKTPIAKKLRGGPTLLTPGKTGPSVFCRKVITSVNSKTVCVVTKINAPIIGPVIVPKPPITLIIKGVKELAGRKIEL